MSIKELLSKLSKENMQHTLKKEGIEVRGKSCEISGYKTNRCSIQYALNLAYPLHKHIAERMLNRKEEYIILDLGCGSGKALSEFEGINPLIRGFGITADLFEDDHPRERIIVGNYAPRSYEGDSVLTRIPDNSIDLIISSTSIQYCSSESYEPLLIESHRILKGNGLAVLDVGDAYNFNRIVNKLKEQIHIRVHTKRGDNEVKTLIIGNYSYR